MPQIAVFVTTFPLMVGVQRARNPVVVFLDADLVGLTDDHVDDLVRPVLDGEAERAQGCARARP